MQNWLFDHIDLRVRNRDEAQKFYAQLLPALGFKRDISGEEWGCFDSGSSKQQGPFFGFTEDPKHRPGESRIAFWASSREKVDRIGEVVRKAGGRNIEGPELCVGYSPGYYALFFDDPSGNKLEVCHRGSGLRGG